MGMGLLLAPALLLFVCFYLIPVGGILLSSFRNPDWSLSNYVEVLSDSSLWSILGHTFAMAAEVTLFCTLLGYPIAYLMLSASEHWRKIITILILLPAWTSALVRAYAWVVLLGRNGLISHLLQDISVTDKPIEILYTRTAVVIGLVHVMLPYFVFPLYGTVRRIDLRLVSAAQSLGAGPITSFLLVFFPLSLPGVTSGGLLTFIRAVGFYVTPALLGGLSEVTYVMLIEVQVNRLVNWPMAATLSVVLLVTTLVLVGVVLKLVGFRAISSGGKDGGQRVVRVIFFMMKILTPFRIWYLNNSSGIRRLRSIQRSKGDSALRTKQAKRPQHAYKLTGVVVCAAVAFILGPILILFPLSFSGADYLQFPPQTYSTRWYTNYFSRADWIGATILSFEVAAIVMVIATLTGTMAAIGLARGKLPGMRICLGFLTSPAIVPTLIIAVGLYFQFSRLGLVGTVPGLVFGHLVIAVPMVIIVVMGALQRIDENLERAARSLGASPVKAFMKITAPLLRASVLSAALFAFLASFDDVVVALFLSGANATTLPKRMWDGILQEVDPTTAAVSSLLIVLSIVLLSVSEFVNRRAKRRGTIVAGP